MFTAAAAVTGSISLSLNQPVNCPLGTSGQLFHSGLNTATSYLSYGNGWFEAQTTTACPPFRYSYDPNEKIVYPSGDIQPGTNLEYTIHFENYGNDTAYAVSVVDSLPKGIDLKSFTFKGSSHPCTIDFDGDAENPILTFHFRGIKLTGKKQDSIQSKGQFTFTINSMQSLQPGDELRNKAHIYFDRNEAIITNTVINRIPLVTKVADWKTTDYYFNVYPNPNKGSFTIALAPLQKGNAVQVLDLQGKEVYKGVMNEAGQIQIKGLRPGMYFGKVSGQKTRAILVSQ